MQTVKTDQTGRMSRLIWVFAGQSYVILLCCGSFFFFFFFNNIVIYYSETEEARWKLYTDTEKIFPRSSAPKRIPLNFTTGTYWSFSQNLKGCLVAWSSAHPPNIQMVMGSILQSGRTFFRGDWPWNHYYGHSLLTAGSSRAVVSYWQKDVH